ncbi:hypothetical protein FACS1894166_05760 [Bacilli bacterium]|nr:hypothetical protein FACS1894166_05760 [Bacilli bacterium]
MELPKDTVDPDAFVRKSELNAAVPEIKNYIDSKFSTQENDSDPFVRRSELRSELIAFGKIIVAELKAYIDKALDEKLDQKLNEKLANVATKNDIAAINKRLDGHDQLFRDHGWL